MKKEKIHKLERRFFTALSCLSPRLNTGFHYYRKFGRLPNLREPRTFNEKLLKLKLERYGKDPLIKQCSDKYAVREYVRACGCEDTLVPLLAVCNSPEEIDWSALPESFVIKWNFGCGYNIICPKKTDLDVPAAVLKLRRWGAEPFWAYYSELQYRNIPRQLLVESYLCDSERHPPADYKIYCFHGKPYCVMVCVGRENGLPRFYYFDRQFRLLRLDRYSLELPAGFTLPKPEGLEKAFAIAERLSAGFPFVRVDLYLLDGKVYFGELTFTPAAALDNKYLPESDLLLGSMLFPEGGEHVSFDGSKKESRNVQAACR